MLFNMVVILVSKEIRAASWHKLNAYLRTMKEETRENRATTCMPGVSYCPGALSPPFLIQLYETAAGTQQHIPPSPARSPWGSSKKGIQRKTGWLHGGKRNLPFAICPFFPLVWPQPHGQSPWQQPLVPVSSFFPHSLLELASLHFLRVNSKAGQGTLLRGHNPGFRLSLHRVLGHFLGDSNPS